MATTTTTIAIDTDVLQAVANARREHLPTPTKVELAPHRHHLHLHVNPEHHTAWRRWWERHGAQGWMPTSANQNGWVHHQVVGHWRGWDVEIVHLELDQARQRIRDGIDDHAQQITDALAGGA